MAVVTTTACQALPTPGKEARSTRVLQDVKNYLESNRLLAHNIRSATMVHNAPPPSLRPWHRSVDPLRQTTYLGVQQAATPDEVTLSANLVLQLARTLIMARVTALSVQALAYFLEALFNAAIWFQALHLTRPMQTLREAVATVQRTLTHVTPRHSKGGVSTRLWG